MSDLKFEEFRQPWETGHHWELKREFIEKYKNDFPDDTLLCLAQAYSNIELLHCSYPDPVMRQIHELSKPLTGCRKFRDMTKKLESSEQRNPKAQKGKRKLLENTPTSSKFIKFCRPVEDQMKSDTSISVTMKTKQSLIKSNDLGSCASNNANFEPEKLTMQKKVHDINKNNVYSSSESQKQLNMPENVQDINKNKVCSSSDSQRQLTVQDINKNNVSSSSDDINTNFVNKCMKRSVHSLIANSIGMDVLLKFISEIRRFLVKNKTPVEAFQCAAQVSKIPRCVVYSTSFVDGSKLHDAKFSCMLSIKGVVIASATESSKKKAKFEVTRLGIDVLLNHLDSATPCVSSTIENCELPVPNSSEISSCCDSVDLAQSSAKSFEETVNSLPNVGSLAYVNSSPSDPSHDQSSSAKTNSILKETLYPSIDVDVSVPIPNSSRGSNKFQEKQGSDLALIYKFKQLIQSNVDHHNALSCFRATAKALSVPFSYICKHNSRCPSEEKFTCNVFLRDIFISSFSCHCKKTARFSAVRAAVDFLLNTSDFEIRTCYGRKHLESYCQKMNQNSSLSPEILNSFEVSGINRNLLQSSLEQHFVLFDNRPESNDSPISLLVSSATFSQKSLSFDYQEESGATKAVVILDGQVFASSVAESKMDAKKAVSALAIEKLKKLFYMIKVEIKDPEPSFVVQRYQILNSDIKTDSVAEIYNVGCKMLKNMGWTGGNIGKSSGIVEPITLVGNSFSCGLGFKKGNEFAKNLKQKIHALLQDFSKSNTFEDLIFSSEFTKEERKLIHEVALRYNLQSVSRGVNSDRYLTVRCKVKLMELLQGLVNAGGELGRYRLYDASHE